MMPLLPGFINQGTYVHINDRNMHCNVYLSLKIASLKQMKNNKRKLSQPPDKNPCFTPMSERPTTS